MHEALADGTVTLLPPNLRSAAVAARAGFAFLQRRSEPDGRVLDWFTLDLRP